MNSTDASQALPGIVLASTSPFRRSLLQRLAIPFHSASPDIDESRLEAESPQQLVTRLSIAKARAVADLYPGQLIIGSDQVACINGEILGKPGTREAAIRQLQLASGQVVSFYTGLCLLNAGDDSYQCECDRFNVHFRVLQLPQIERYLDAEEPYNCAGSFKSEGLGIALFQRLEGDDPNALIGLPLIRLVRMLEAEGIAIP